MALSLGKRRMLNVVLILLVGLVFLIVALAVAVAFQPNEFQVTRSMKMDAPPEVVFPHVNQFSAWEAWSPYEKLDPNMSKSLDGPAAGQGAIMRWSGNGNAGAGSTTIVQSEPNEAIQIDLEITEPMACRNDVLFTFQPEGNSTVVTWSMSGKVGFMAKFFHLIFDIDKMCGDQFTEGLTKLKEISEKQAAAATS
ncbi:Polyketide cyclase / dehydrase and lipid transport [Bremerella volcania]|uniref:Polyketide cyclase / dehydrase and lipid transport n=1 Tax=Bremerella volcania TaxID=2527984 RepID=A0A518CDK4_9BACT|nr:SRPBCC family protein [Bremerella volcania]QDU77305.1 Polyketide cyclase / dehydrase and lipid transport [Bremerella volcania]